jgi:hypothetical protein
LMAASISSTLRPGLAVTWIWKSEPSISEYCWAVTFCAICFS